MTYGAHLTVMAEAPVEADPDDLIDVPLLLTAVDGDVVVRADELD